MSDHPFIESTLYTVNTWVVWSENDDAIYEHCYEQPLKKTPSKIQERVK